MVGEPFNRIISDVHSCYNPPFFKESKEGVYDVTEIIRNSVMIVANIHTPAINRRAFGIISTTKGASIVNMIEQVLQIENDLDFIFVVKISEVAK